jgi:hypothetical protein
VVQVVGDEESVQQSPSITSSITASISSPADSTQPSSLAKQSTKKRKYFHFNPPKHNKFQSIISYVEVWDMLALKEADDNALYNPFESQMILNLENYRLLMQYYSYLLYTKYKSYKLKQMSSRTMSRDQRAQIKVYLPSPFTDQALGQTQLNSAQASDGQYEREDDLIPVFRVAANRDDVAGSNKGDDASEVDSVGPDDEDFSDAEYSSDEDSIAEVKDPVQQPPTEIDHPLSAAYIDKHQKKKRRKRPSSPRKLFQRQESVEHQQTKKRLTSLIDEIKERKSMRYSLARPSFLPDPNEGKETPEHNARENLQHSAIPFSSFGGEPSVAAAKDENMPDFYRNVETLLQINLSLNQVIHNSFVDYNYLYLQFYKSAVRNNTNSLAASLTDGRNDSTSMVPDRHRFSMLPSQNPLINQTVPGSQRDD